MSKGSEPLCPGCGQPVPIAQVIGVCGKCLRDRPEQYLPAILSRHESLRKLHGLPPHSPHSPIGQTCGFCAKECRLREGELGYCGAREGGKRGVVGGVGVARVGWYHDPLPTNCVADWVCPAGSQVGFPKFSYRRGQESGYFNLAVFYESCNFHCLNCQNWRFRESRPGIGQITPQELAQAVHELTACICYFGGDPGPSLPHSLKASRLARKKAKNRPLRICWETNGSMRESFLQGMLGLALESGGIIKFDLKAYSPPIHLALTGADNQQTLSNFAWLARQVGKRKEYPLLVASTLLVPGMVEAEEVEQIARFIASFSSEIPYALLAFHPDCHLRDLPLLSRDQAETCLAAAKSAGLNNVRLGNSHLLTS